MEDVDRVSDLPDSILCHILSFLSTKDAVVTSILSTRWRYLFTLLSNLDFDLGEFTSSDRRPKISSIKIFLSFVGKMLFFHKTNVDKFRLKCGIRVDCCHVYGLILAAVWRGVKHLDLNISYTNVKTLPDALFACRTLVALKLDIHFVLDVPKVKNLFSSCTNLEDVIIEKCNMENINNFNISHHLLQSLTILHSNDSSNCWLIIDSPNLAYFKYIDHVVGGYSLENLQSIVSVDIHFIIEDDDLQADATALFREISNVRSLLLSSTSLKLLLSCESLPIFASMVELKLYCEHSYEYWEKGLESLLTSSPELEKLDFDQEVLISLPEKVPSCLSFKLEVTEFSNFRDDKDCIEKVKYILKHGGALQKLTIHTATYYHDEEKMKIADELFASPRESKQCCILIVW
ncbi:hypothetical protein Golax_017778 [Gossypium laxum]|uniref:F-box domain-containing protein n=1 Tax=Gossypium laxum TaxID=34288 RepID=A0A7J8Z2L2_9ROSI|nr:hypothetical protein [Gossypium laxum]